MQVLLFVITLLMLLSTISYSRLELFLQQSLLLREYTAYQHFAEGSEQNKKQLEIYKKHKGEDSEEKKQNAESGKSLPIHSFLQREKVGQDPNAIHELLKRLMQNLYGDKHFFLEIQEKRPSFLDELLVRMAEAAKEEKITYKKDLSKLDLQDAELQEVYAKMLRGNKSTHNNDKREYDSLSEYVQTQSGRKKIQLLHASPPLLLAIYGDPSLVEEIIDRRKHIKSDKEFRDLFEGQESPDVPASLLDYSVPKPEKEKST